MGSKSSVALAANVKKFRERDKLTQVQLAEKTKLGKNTIQRIEEQRGMPSFYTLQSLAEFFKVSVAELCKEGKNVGS